MEGFITSIVAVLIISFISSVIKNAKKNLQNSKEQTNSSNNQPQSLQSLIRDQVNQHKDALMEQFNNITSFDNESSRYKEGDKLNRKTLEGTPVEHQRHTHNAHFRESYNEGDKLDRDTLEGITLEGDPLYGEDSMSLDALNLDNSEVLSVKKVHKTKTTKPRKYVGSSYRGLKLDRDGIVNGVIMAEVLEKRGGRR